MLYRFFGAHFTVRVQNITHKTNKTETLVSIYSKLSKIPYNEHSQITYFHSVIELFRCLLLVEHNALPQKETECLINLKNINLSN